MKQMVPFFAVIEPYELYYKMDVAAEPVSAHTHNGAEIYVTLTDLPDVLLNDTVSKVQKGSLIIIPPFCLHQLYHEKGIVYERYILNLDTEWLDHVLMGHHADIDYLKNPVKPLIISLGDRQLSELTEHMKQLIEAKNEKNIGTLACFFDLFHRIHSYVENTWENHGCEERMVTGAQKRVNEMIAYINQNVIKGISVGQIADHFYLNKDYVSRLFSQHTHTSIGRYVAMQRISKAQELLREGKTVTEVQELMEYSSYAHFFKTFQKLTGISPSQYRRQYTDHKLS